MLGLATYQRRAGAIEREDQKPDDHADAPARVVVAAVLAGDRDAYRVLVDRESARVVRACFRVLGDVSEAEDVAQEAFVAAYRALGSWRGDGQFGAWLSRIALRLAVRRAAARSRTLRWVEPVVMTAASPGHMSDDRGDGAGPGDLLAGHRGRGADPATAFLAAEQNASVRRAVGRLEEPYREVVALRFFGELSLTEIADQRGTPLSTVKTHLRRGLARLRSVLDAEGLAR